MKGPAFSNPAVEAVFAAYPKSLRAPLLDLRRTIFSVAAETDGVGTLVETLKWGQPASLTERPKSGSTIRIDAVKGRADRYALYVHCQTTLVPTYRELYPNDFTFEGNRALIFSTEDALPQDALKHCIALALTYHAKARVL